ncbi:MAG: maleate cis-trans isomerase family protein [Sciscionella sp.]
MSIETRSTVTPEVELRPNPPGIGIVVPHDFALDAELWRWTPAGVSLYLTRTPPAPPDGTRLERLSRYADLDAIKTACRALATPKPAVVAYMCTSCTFIHGLAGDRAVSTAISQCGNQRALTTSGAMLAALQALRVSRVAIATPYDAVVTKRLEAFLTEGGITTTASAYLDVPGEIWRVPSKSTRALVRSLRTDDTEAVFISCTNLPTYDVIPHLENELGIPVLSANLVTMWAALQALRHTPNAQPERLFTVSS